MDRVWRALSLCVVVCVLGCGDDDGATDAGSDAATPDAPMLDAPLDADVAGAPQGLFEILEMRSFEDETGMLELTLRRDSTPLSVRGRIEFTPTGETTRDMSVVIAELTDGLLGGEGDEPVTLDAFPVTFEGSKAIVEVDVDRLMVFDVSTRGDEISMVRDASDERDNLPIEEGPSAIVMRPIAAPMIVGDYRLVEYTDAETGETIEAGACQVEGSGSMRFEVTFAIDARGAMSINESSTFYSDTECTTENGGESGGPVGFAEEDGDTLRLWMVVPDDVESSMHLELTYELGDTLVMTRTGCLPSPDCDTDGPSRLVMAAL